MEMGSGSHLVLLEEVMALTFNWGINNKEDRLADYANYIGKDVSDKERTILLSLVTLLANELTPKKRKKRKPKRKKK